MHKLSIKALTLKNLREGTEPFFYLAPDVVGSINNAYPSKGKKLFVIDFNTIDDHNVKLSVPHKTYGDYFAQNKQHAFTDGNSLIKDFLLKFLDGAKPYEPSDDEPLDEIVDEFGNLFSDDDKPVDIRGNPGYGNTKITDTAKNQYRPRYTRYMGPMGYGSVTW